MGAAACGEVVLGVPQGLSLADIDLFACAVCVSLPRRDVATEPRSRVLGDAAGCPPQAVPSWRPPAQAFLALPSLFGSFPSRSFCHLTSLSMIPCVLRVSQGSVL